MVGYFSKVKLMAILSSYECMILGLNQYVIILSSSELRIILCEAASIICEQDAIHISSNESSYATENGHVC